MKRSNQTFLCSFLKRPEKVLVKLEHLFKSFSLAGGSAVLVPYGNNSYN